MSRLLFCILKNNNRYQQIRFASQILPQLSSEKYNVKRKEFSYVQTTDINYFKSILDDKRVLTDVGDVLPFNIDWIKNCRGQSKVVLKPKSTAEVSEILFYCNEKRLAVCPQGGNTGLVGGSVPVFDEIVLSLSLMNKVISLDEISGALVCEAGCILEALDQHVRDHNLIMPLDLGAKGSCQIGGNISTNAGGLRLLRYGNLHGSLLGVEAVQANGTIIDCLRTLRKDNTGYHLKHLFVGSEGTLGIVTKVALHCPALPKAVTLGYFGVENFDNILQLYKSAKSSLGEILSAFEMADVEAINSSVQSLKVQNQLSEYPFYVLIETHGSNEDHDADKLNSFLEKEMKSGLILDGVVTSDPSKMQAIWHIRESIAGSGILDGYVYKCDVSIPQAQYYHLVPTLRHRLEDFCMGNLHQLTCCLRHSIYRAIWHIRESIAGSGILDGYVYKYDVSIPQARYYDLVPTLRRRLGDSVTRVYGYGHVGDGNIHINVTGPEYSKTVTSLLEPFIFEQVSLLQGSVSAEHGIGFKKPQFIHFSKDQSALSLMAKLKGLMDPNGILNPYKVLPDV